MNLEIHVPSELAQKQEIKVIKYFLFLGPHEVESSCIIIHKPLINIRELFLGLFSERAVRRIDFQIMRLKPHEYFPEFWFVTNNRRMNSGGLRFLWFLNFDAIL